MREGEEEEGEAEAEGEVESHGVSEFFLSLSL